MSPAESIVFTLALRSSHILQDVLVQQEVRILLAQCHHNQSTSIRRVRDRKPGTCFRSTSYNREVRRATSEWGYGANYMLGVAIVGEAVCANYESSVRLGRNKREVEPSPYPEYQARSSLSLTQSTHYRRLMTEAAHQVIFTVLMPNSCSSGQGTVAGSHFLTHHVCSLPLVRSRRM